MTTRHHAALAGSVPIVRASPIVLERPIVEPASPPAAPLGRDRRPVQLADAGRITVCDHQRTCEVSIGGLGEINAASVVLPTVRSIGMLTAALSEQLCASPRPWPHVYSWGDPPAASAFDAVPALRAVDAMLHRRVRDARVGR